MCLGYRKVVVGARVRIRLRLNLGALWHNGRDEHQITPDNGGGVPSTWDRDAPDNVLCRGPSVRVAAVLDDALPGWTTPPGPVSLALALGADDLDTASLSGGSVAQHRQRERWNRNKQWEPSSDACGHRHRSFRGLRSSMAEASGLIIIRR